MKARHAVASVAVALLAAGCSPDDPMAGENPTEAEATRLTQPLPVWFFGTVHRIPDNGGAWVVRTAGGTQYQPNGLPEEFQVDGLAVEVEARKHDVTMANETLGQAIDIVEIRKRGDPPAP